MAQRTGAYGLVALCARPASARLALALAAVAALGLSACGGGSSGPAATADASNSSSSPEGTQSTAAGGKSGGGAGGTVADLSLESYSPFPSGEGGPASLPTNYGCAAEDKWPQFHWKGVPAGTAELVLYAMNVRPVEGKLFVDWAVAGLKPDLPEIVSGQLPKGAVVGTNSFGKQGYSLCPTGSGETYKFALYALPKRLAPPKGFDARELRREVLAASSEVGLLPMLYAHG